jgi:two-component system cell cycle sensor histidine kinase PleC
MTATHNGTGLGLPLAKAMLELHGGRLEIESAPGRGTTVLLLFPAERISGGRRAAA